MARSSAEAELRSAAHEICEALWLKLLLEELGLELHIPLQIHCDNKASIAITHNPVHHDRIKHVEVDRHLIKEKIDEGIIDVTYIPTHQQTANILTKPLHKPLYDRMVDKLGMYNLYNPS